MRPIAIEAAGAFTSVGLNLPQTATSLRTRVHRFSETDIQGPPPDRENIVGAATLFPLGKVQGRDRLLALGVPALRECAKGAERERTPIFLCAPEGLKDEDVQDKDRHKDIASMLPILAKAAGIEYDQARSRVIQGGRSAAILALAQAERLLIERSCEACYIGGIDSLVDDEALLRMIDAERVKHSQNPSGFIPGEAAAFIRVSLRPKKDPLAWVSGLAIAAEPVSRSAGKPSSGVGLARAMREALANAKATGPDISWLVHDCAGERYDFSELALAVARLPLERQQTFVSWDAATSVGEIGAASAVLALAYIAFAMTKGVAPGPGAMVVARSSTGEERAAAFIQQLTMRKG